MAQTALLRKSLIQLKKKNKLNFFSLQEESSFDSLATWGQLQQRIFSLIWNTHSVKHESGVAEKLSVSDFLLVKYCFTVTRLTDPSFKKFCHITLFWKSSCSTHMGFLYVGIKVLAFSLWGNILLQSKFLRVWGESCPRTLLAFQGVSERSQIKL